jgi:predicted DNA-binding WGR domain protein
MGAKGTKEIAPPNTKVEVKTFNRAAEGGATAESIEEEKTKKSYADPKNIIYKSNEVDKEAESLPDDRPEPECELMYKQHVGTEDVYLGLSDKDPSSNHCDSILVKVHLPDT